MSKACTLHILVKPREETVFKGPLLEVQGPVRTQFGYHLIKTLQGLNNYLSFATALIYLNYTALD